MREWLNRWFRPKDEVASQPPREFLLYVTSFDGEGYATRWFGWSQNLTFASEAAAFAKWEEIQDRFYDYEIVELMKEESA